MKKKLNEIDYDKNERKLVSKFETKFLETNE